MAIRMELLEQWTYRQGPTNWTRFIILLRIAQNARVRNTYGYEERNQTTLH